MSQETQQWLDTMTIHGYGRIPWHGREGNDNIYPEAVPVAAVLERLFNFHTISAPVLIEIPATFEDMTALNEAGEPVRHVKVARQAIVPNDRLGSTFTDADLFGIFKDGYARHEFAEWLLDKVSHLHLPIGSAGLLRNRGQAWVSFETPETSFVSGVGYYPRLLATTSHDGTTASTYKLVFTLVVCDNTREFALSEKSPTIKVKHSRYSALRSTDLTDTLGLMAEATEAFGAEIEALTNVTVSEAQWQSILARLVPTGDGKRSLVTAKERRESIDALYHYDTRVSPWAGTAFGALQAMNTYDQHKKAVRGATVRQDRTMLDTLGGRVGERDRDVLAVVAEVCGLALV